MNDRDTNLLTEVYQNILENEEQTKLQAQVDEIKTKTARLKNKIDGIFYVNDFINEDLDGFATIDILKWPKMHGLGMDQVKYLRSPMKTVLKQLERDGYISPYLTVSKYSNKDETPGFYFNKSAKEIKQQLENIEAQWQYRFSELLRTREKLEDRLYDLAYPR